MLSLRFAFLTVVAVTSMGLFGCGTWNSACAQPVTESNPSVKPPSAASRLKIVESPIAANCFTVSKEKRKIDTIVIHYSSAINWFDPEFQKIVSPAGKAYAESIHLTKENVGEHKYDWKLIKYIFETYKVSANYMIPRDGTVVRLVKDNNVAWHAGVSKMPTDGREKVNAFSIGIEIMSTHPKDDSTVKTPADAYTDAQYAALDKLIAQICKTHKITAVVGHDEIAPGRKTDPGPLFQWDRVRTPDFKPVVCGKK